MTMESLWVETFGALSFAWASFQTYVARRYHLAAGQASSKAIQAEAKAGEYAEAAAVSRELEKQVDFFKHQTEIWRERYDKSDTEWQHRLDALHAENEKLRDYHHEKANKDASLLGKCQEENIRLKERTDLQPILGYIESLRGAILADAKVREQTLNILSTLTSAIERIHERFDQIERQITDAPPH